MVESFNSLENMGITPPTSPKAKNLAKAAFTPSKPDVSSPAPGDKAQAPTPTDKTTAPAAAKSENQVNAPNPIVVLQTANHITQELLSLSKLKPDQNIKVVDQNGKTVEKPVKEVVVALKQELNQAFQVAINSADTINASKFMPELKAQLAQTTQEVTDLAKSLNLDPNKLTISDLEKAKANSVIGSKQFEDLGKLINVATEQNHLSELVNAPGLTRLFYAQSIVSGLTENSANSGQLILGQVSKTDIEHAHVLLTQAGKLSTEVKNIPVFTQLNDAITQVLKPGDNGAPLAPVVKPEAQTGTNIVTAAQSVNQALAEANTLDKAGNTAKAQLAFEKAIALTKNINIPKCVGEFNQAQKAGDSAKANEYAQIIQVKENAKIDYANFLVKHGDSQKALKLAVELNNDNNLKMISNNSGLNKLLSLALFANCPTGGELDAKFSKFQTDMNSKDFSKAQSVLAELKTDSLKTYQQSQKAQKALLAQEAEINVKIANLAKDSTLTQAEKDFETLRLQNELALNKKVQTINDQAKSQYPYAVYLSGVLAAAQGKRDEAHNDFLSVEKDFPDFAKNKDLNLPKYIDDTKPENWFERNWTSIKDGLCIAAGVGAGLGAAALTIWSGPGAAIAGLEAGTVVTTALIGATALGASAVAGAGAYTAAHAGFGDKVTWGTAEHGAVLGLEGGATIASFGLGAGAIGAGATADASIAATAATAGDAGAVADASIAATAATASDAGAVADASTAAVADVTAGTTDATANAVGDAGSLSSDSSFLSRTASQIGKFSSKTLGFSRYSLGVGYGTAGTVQGAKYLTGQESLKSALENTAWQGAMIAMPLGWASNAGKAAADAGLTGSSLAIKAIKVGAVQANFFPNAPLISTVLPIGIDAYKNYSPIQLGGMVRSGETLNMNRQSNQELFWQRINEMNPTLVNPQD